MTRGFGAATRNDLWRGICLFACGLGTGWLIGLSVAPVIQGVVTSLIAVVVSLVGVMAGIQFPGNQRTAASSGSPDESDPESKGFDARRRLGVSPAPIALLIVGVAIGASCGIYVRSHNWLGVEQDSATNSDVVRAKLGVGYLFAGAGVSVEEYERLQTVLEGDLAGEMMQSKNPKIRAFAAKCEGHPKCLKAAVEELICRESR